MFTTGIVYGTLLKWISSLYRCSFETTGVVTRTLQTAHEWRGACSITAQIRSCRIRMTGFRERPPDNIVGTNIHPFTSPYIPRS